MKVKIRTLPAMQYVIGASLPATVIVLIGGISIPFVYWVEDFGRIWVDDNLNKWSF